MMMNSCQQKWSIKLTIPSEIASATVNVPNSMKFIGTLVLRVLTHIIGIMTTRATPQQTYSNQKCFEANILKSKIKMIILLKVIFLLTFCYICPQDWLCFLQSYHYFGLPPWNDDIHPPDTHTKVFMIKFKMKAEDDSPSDIVHSERVVEEWKQSKRSFLQSTRVVRRE